GVCLSVYLILVTECYVWGVGEVLRELFGFRVLVLLGLGRGKKALRLLDAEAKRFESLLRNTVNTTIVKTKHKINVIPSETLVNVNKQILPSFKPKQFIEKMQSII